MYETWSLLNFLNPELFYSEELFKNFFIEKIHLLEKKSIKCIEKI